MPRLLMLLLIAHAAIGCAAARPPRLLDVEDGEWGRHSPQRYGVLLSTSYGDIQLAVVRSLAPLGADRFYNLVRGGYYDGSRFDRVVPGFCAQFGFAPDPTVTARQQQLWIPEEPTLVTNSRGTISWAQSGLPHSRSTVVFINLADNAYLDQAQHAVFGVVVSGMEVLDNFPESCPEVAQALTKAVGEKYLNATCPSMPVIQDATITPFPRPGGRR